MVFTGLDHDHHAAIKVIYYSQFLNIIAKSLPSPFRRNHPCMIILEAILSDE